MKNLFTVLTSLLILSLAVYYFLPVNSVSEPNDTTLRYSTGTRDNPKAREVYEFNMLKNPATGKIPAGIRLKELELAKKNLYKSSSLGKSYFSSWSFRGPSNVGGRTRALAVDVTDDNIFLAGGVSSGMYRTTNQGDTWTKVTSDDALPNVTAIAQNKKPGKTNIWYYGTGEKLGNSASASADFLGNGLYKSTDNGLSWNVLPATYSITPESVDPFDYCYRLVTNPFSSYDDEVLAALVGGIARSTDGGETWEPVLGYWGENMSIITDIALAENGKFYASFSTVGAGGTSNSAGIYTSSDGENWTNITPVNFPSAHIRTIIAPSKSNPNKVYFLSNLPTVSNNDNNQLWVYNAGSNTWERKMNFSSDFSTQGEYCMALAVHPTDENIVFVGGVGLFRTDDGFSSQNMKHIGGDSDIHPYYVYPNHWVDQHVITFLNNSPSTMVSGNDAGVSLTTNCTADSVVWEYKPNNYITSQFYTLDISPNSNNQTIMGGLQDRGTWGIDDASLEWDQVPYAGDGSYCALTSNDSLFYISIQNGKIVRMFLDNDDLIITRVDPGEAGLFITPFELDPNNQNVMYLAKGDTLYRNSNLSAIPFEDDGEPTYLNWEPLFAFDQIITAVTVSKNPADIIYVGTFDGSVYKVTYDETGSSSELISGSDWAGYPICIAVNEENADEIITVFSNYEIPSLYHSLDGGNNWTDVSGSLEEFPDGSGSGPSCRWANIVTHGTNKMFLVGTSTGLYYTYNLQGQSTNWIHEDGVIKNSVVSMIKSRNSDGFVALSTHGKGVYSTTISTDVRNEIVLTDYSLSQNYPNPFNPSTKIEFVIPAASHVSLKIFDITGREVKTVINKNMQGGRHSVDFNAASLASGIYFYKISADKFNETKKMTLIK